MMQTYYIENNRAESESQKSVDDIVYHSELMNRRVGYCRLK